MEAAAGPSLQVKGRLRAKLTVGGGHPSTEGGQTLKTHAQSHQEQHFALHLEACHSVGATGHSPERGQTDAPGAGGGNRQSLGPARGKAESRAARSGSFLGGRGIESDTVSTPRLLM